MNLPNRLTMVRLLLVPVMIAVYLLGVLRGGPAFRFLGTTLTFFDVLVFLIFAVASLTDFLDGQIARRYHLITTFGKFIDPIADKLLVNSALILLAYDRRIPILCLLIMVGRDTIVDAIRFVCASNNKVVAASFFGKAKTMTQMIGICWVMLNNPIFAAMHIPFDQIMIILATIISFASGVDYFIKSKDYILESM